ncbi:MAG: 30S ribosomal protein S7 [Candidatus Aenigmarchaeota archaeon]|nr:30S ribosomal protein S7 [Candidatus Aenigmarchaeota archaeon]
MSEIKLFNRWDTSEVKVSDLGLERYINLKPVIIPKSFGRNSQKQFHKSNMNIVERLINHMYVPGHKRKKHFLTSGACVGKTETIFNVVIDAFNIIEQKTKKNPVEVFVKAIENSAMREELTSFQVGGIIVRKAVITSPQRRVDIVLREFAQGSFQKAIKAKKPMSVCLADEIFAAYNNSSDSYAIREKDRIEKESLGAR